MCLTKSARFVVLVRDANPSEVVAPRQRAMSIVDDCARKEKERTISRAAHNQIGNQLPRMVANCSHFAYAIPLQRM